MTVDDRDSGTHGYGPAPDDPVAFDAGDANYGRGPVVLILAVVMVVAAAGIIFAVYEQGARSRSEPATITADLAPEKVAPTDPGGVVVEHQDKFIYDQISGTERPQVEVLLPESEEPLDLSGLRTVSDNAERVVATTADEGEEAEAVAVEGAVTPRPKPELSTPVASEPEPEPVADKTVESLILETTPDTPPTSTGSAISGNYVVQVGAYDGSSLASRAWDKMRSEHNALLANLRPDIQVADLGNKGTWYRLRVGPFSDRSSADKLCGQLKAAGQDCLVKKP